MATILANRQYPNENGWADRHDEAIKLSQLQFEQPVVAMLKGWEKYAKDHKARYESNIGDDGVLGDPWKEIGLGIRTLLNGETGRLDCGTLDAFILDTLNENGVDTSKHSNPAQAHY